MRANPYAWANLGLTLFLIAAGWIGIYFLPVHGAVRIAAGAVWMIGAHLLVEKSLSRFVCIVLDALIKPTK
jgi:hypothetical protein